MRGSVYTIGMHNITHTFHPMTAPKVLATITEITVEAIEEALSKFPGHAAKVIDFEIDAENPGCADAFTDRGEVYAIENA